MFFAFSDLGLKDKKEHLENMEMMGYVKNHKKNQNIFTFKITYKINISIYKFNI